MTNGNAFPDTELNARVSAVRAQMAERNLDGLLIASPENIYYLTGLDHWGFFATHVLVVPREGEMALVTRAMEGITVNNMVANAKFYGHADHEEPSDYVIKALTALGLMGARLALEEKTLFLTPHVSSLIKAGAPSAPVAGWFGDRGRAAACKVAPGGGVHSGRGQGGGCRNVGSYRGCQRWRQ